MATANKKLAHAKAELVLAQAKQKSDNKQQANDSNSKPSSSTKETKKKSTKKFAKKTTKKVVNKVEKAKKAVVASSKFTSLKGSKKAFVGNWKKAMSVSGYQVRYNTASSMKKAKTKSTEATKVKISHLKNKKKYYVQLRSYRKISVKTYYSASSKVKNVKTQ